MQDTIGNLLTDMLTNIIEKLTLFFALTAIGLMTCASSYGNQAIIINKPLGPNDPRYQYTYELMSLIVKATEAEFGPIEVRHSDIAMTRKRTLNELALGEKINVMAEAPKADWDKRLLVVPIPIRKGLQGYRLFIIHQDNRILMNGVTNFADLQKLATGSGSYWSTRKPMEQAGMKVITGSNYQGLFTMLANKRFMTFGRGINEAYHEVAAFKDKYPVLEVDNNLLLHIPLATYFYISPNRPELAKRIEKGLLKLIDSGDFDHFFYRRFCPDIVKSKLDKRKTFHIDNHQVSVERMTNLVGSEFLIDTNHNYNDICQPYLSKTSQTTLRN